MKTLNLRSLHIVETVAGVGSLLRAAESLAMTQPAVSMVIGQLGTKIGASLFDPQTRRQLSDARRELLQHARLIVTPVHAADLP